jgi:hypothetical protein
VPEDELLTYQIFDTFATVSQSDPSWTEMIWTIAHARDNSLQVVVGIGKYTNRGVFDGAAGVCRGTEQWTVRAGRRLSSASASTDVRPIHYHVVEPSRAVRVSLEQPSTPRSPSTSSCGGASTLRSKTLGRIAVRTGTESPTISCGITRSGWPRDGWRWTVAASKSNAARTCRRPARRNGTT